MSSSSQGDFPSETPTTSNSSRSGSHTPQQTPSNSYSQAASYFSYPVSHVVSGLYRRLTDPNIANAPSNMPWSMSSSSSSVFTPRRTASPFQPPPLTPLSLIIPKGQDLLQQQLLTRALAEEIRLLVPARLQLVENWRLAYSLDRDGASLSTLYDNCEEFSHRSPRAGYVLVCFLWRASILPPPSTLGLAFTSDGPQTEEALERAGLPPPPSADTTHAGRWSTFRSDPGAKSRTASPAHNLNMNIKTNLAAASGGALAPPSPSSVGTPSRSGASTPERIRFKAFPYSGVNDYMMFCETGFLSLGGGDGRYGLWVDSGLEKGVSSHCQTFGNEPLSDEGEKFDILGIEVWYVGS
ncbi:Oxidation resistance protein 1 [Penicillium atrosanguineum]|nr:Oxidation resistance protein 1 [Penicillium atrosanguineum]